MAEEGDTPSRRPKRGDPIDATHGLVQLILLGLSILVAVAIDTGSSSRGILFVLLILFSWVLPVSLLMAQARPDDPPPESSPEPPRPACGQCGIDLRPGAVQCHWCHWRMPASQRPAATFRAGSAAEDADKSQMQHCQTTRPPEAAAPNR